MGKEMSFRNSKPNPTHGVALIPFVDVRADQISYQQIIILKILQNVLYHCTKFEDKE